MNNDEAAGWAVVGVIILALSGIVVMIMMAYAWVNWPRLWV